MQARRIRPIALAASLSLAALSACSSSSDSTPAPSVQQNALFEAEPNDDATTALALQLTRPATGEVNVNGDVDFWKVNLTAGTVVAITIRGAEFDYATWLANSNVPRLTLYAADGTTKLVEQDLSGNFSDGWGWHWGDLDIPNYYVETSGEHYIAVTQDDVGGDGGAYVLEVNRVTGWGTISMETESATNPNSNDTPATAQAITSGSYLGHHDVGEDDYYSFTVAVPSRMRFETFTYRNGAYDGGDYFDTQVELFDTDGTTSLFNNNDDYFYDSGLDYMITTPGTYFIRVNDDGGPQGPGQYLMKLAVSPLTSTATEVEPNEDPASGTALAFNQTGLGHLDNSEVDYLNFTGNAGDQIRIYVYDGNAGFDEFLDFDLVDSNDNSISYEWQYDNFFIVNTILQSTGTFSAILFNGGASTDYAIRIEKIAAATPEVEPNDVQVDAQTFTGKRVMGVIDVALDVDTYSFTATEDYVVEFACYAGDWNTMAQDYQGFGSNMYPSMTIRDSNGTAIAMSQNDDNTGFSTENTVDPSASAHLTFLAPATGTYTIEVTDMYDDFGSSFYYVLERR